MTITVGIRDLIRDSSILDNHDYVDIEDKRSHTYKGLFVAPKYAQELKAYLDEKIKAEKSSVLHEVMQFAGSAGGEFNNNSIQELTTEKRARYDE
ncbi:MAG: hypothetical protein B6I36_10840 [Desulfobacteraceae bacterium 4572_35.1]|nr:MAG: hypothetical protein B6I36_10840 [Desulfobacteraceae bacterium 4572_35.1]